MYLSRFRLEQFTTTRDILKQHICTLTRLLIHILLLIAGIEANPGPNMPLNLETVRYLQLVELKEDFNIYHAILKSFYDNIDTETMKNDIANLYSDIQKNERHKDAIQQCSDKVKPISLPKVDEEETLDPKFAEYKKNIVGNHKRTLPLLSAITCSNDIHSFAMIVRYIEEKNTQSNVWRTIHFDNDKNLTIERNDCITTLNTARIIPNDIPLYRKLKCITENLISKPISVKTDTNVSVGCVGSIDFPAYTLPEYNIPQYIYNRCFESNRNGIYTAELIRSASYFLVHITGHKDKHQIPIRLLNKLHSQHIINKNEEEYKITGAISRDLDNGLFVLIYIHNGNYWILKPGLNPEHRRLEKDEKLVKILYETHFLIYSRVNNMKRLAPSRATSTNRKRSYSQTRMNSQHYRNPNSITKNAPRSKQSSYNYRKNAIRNQSRTHKEDTTLDVILKQTKYSKPIPTPITNTNKQYYNKVIQNSKCITDHLNILQCNIQCVSSTFERIDKLITTQIASAYDPNILLISETLADNSKLLKLQRPNWHFELHSGYTKT